MLPLENNGKQLTDKIALCDSYWVIIQFDYGVLIRFVNYYRNSSTA